MSELLPLSQIFVRHSRVAVPAELLATAGLEHALQDALARGRSAWPDLILPATTFIEHLAQRMVATGAAEATEPPTLIQTLTRLNVGDLYLACACLGHDKLAAELFSRQYLAQVSHLIAHMRLAKEEVDDIRQSLGERLFIGTADGRPRLAEYSGQGTLLSWIRIAAIRSALDRRRQVAPLAVDPQTLTEVVADGRDVQQEYLKHRYRQHFEDALRTALTQLSAEQRNILRLHFVDGLSIDKLGTLFKIHRATAARWIVSARDTLLAAVRVRLAERLNLNPSEVDSLGRLVRSQLHLSLHRILGNLDGTT